MTTSTDERNRILDMVEAGQITAAQAAELLDALEPAYVQPASRIENRTLRIWLTDTSNSRRKMNVTATLPLSLVSTSLRLLARMVSEFNDSTMQHVIRAVEKGTTGRLIDVQDLEEGKRLEIFVEK
ncbi:MAG TPA: hypothetical protein VEH81_02595 [Ktedonobacteraceae bacterium]|nr:hypothetical protein [Ktedonobacteraceae bacterium]